ncbi:LacI family DNA-binding transcriptional regulator [Kineococcus sp. GCM10028916]|uniref:LacI family DNA-binding transcriptional regulator n=1 Tax=Kineococcus sp. GCM10028916 TaxID=3273394 RepID=UPI00363A8809
MSRVSSEDIARAAQVSRATVSYVLNDRPGRRISAETRQRVLQTARSLGYVPNPAAMALRSGRSDIVLLQENAWIPGPDQDVLPLGSTSGLLRDAVAREVRAWGMTLVSAGTGFPLGHALTHLMPTLVLAPAGLSEVDRDALRRSRVPWYEPAPPEGFPEAGSGGEAMSLTASLALAQVEHLRERGHRRIGYLNTSVEAVRDIAEQRERAVRQAASAVGVECDHRVRLGPVEDALPECTATLEQWMADGVTAVACFNDLYAGLAVKVLRQRGSRIPDDLAVLGVDDEAMSWMLEPPLSTVRLRMAEFGTHLAACGRAVLDGHPLPPLPAGLTPVVARATT